MHQRTVWIVIGILLVLSLLFIGAALMKDKHSIPTETATFAGGCFWCIQKPFDAIPGVISTTVGYTGGQVENPTYEQVCSGKTGHVEAIRIIFDPKKVSYKELLTVYWHNIDPTQKAKQFCDYGTQYQPIIFYHGREQKNEAEESKKKLQIYPVVVEIRPAGPFYSAEAYHQKYYIKYETNYNQYHDASGRSERLKELWDPK